MTSAADITISPADVTAAVEYHLKKNFNLAAAGKGVEFNYNCVEDYASTVTPGSSIVTAQVRDQSGLKMKIALPQESVEAILKSYFHDVRGQDTQDDWNGVTAHPHLLGFRATLS
jgi:hypothetical protein